MQLLFMGEAYMRKYGKFWRDDTRLCFKITFGAPCKKSSNLRAGNNTLEVFDVIDDVQFIIAQRQAKTILRLISGKRYRTNSVLHIS